MGYKADVFLLKYFVLIFIFTPKIFANLEKNQGLYECCKLGIYEAFKYLPNCENKKCGDEFTECCKVTYDLRACEEGKTRALKISDCDIFAFDSIPKICCTSCMNALLHSSKCNSSESMHTGNTNLQDQSYHSCCFANENKFAIKRSQTCKTNEDCSKLEICDKGKCKCDKGFRYVDRKCVDINECEKNPCPLESNCYNTYGSYECICNVGFNMTENGTCEDINECEITSLCLHGKCVNTIGSYRCESKILCQNGIINDKNECICREGMRYDNFLKICTDIKKCIDESCNKDEICVDLIDGFKCEKVLCPIGYNQIKAGECIKNGSAEDFLSYRIRFITSAIRGISLFVIDLKDTIMIDEKKLIVLPPHSDNVAILQYDHEHQQEHIILNQTLLGPTVLNMIFLSIWRPQGFLMRRVVQRFILTVYIDGQ